MLPRIMLGIAIALAATPLASAGDEIDVNDTLDDALHSVWRVCALVPGHHLPLPLDWIPAGGELGEQLDDWDDDLEDLRWTCYGLYGG